jgi:hypothetical protein
MRRLAVILVLALTLAGCGSGAVVFAPTPPPPDLSPLPYRHPGGAFTAVIPRDWSVYEQNTTTLASAAFSPPGAAAPLARFAVVNTGQLVDSGLLAAAINRYQTELRPGAARYQEVSRSAMGDGSWRLVGLLHTPSGQTQPLNTFIEADGALIAVIETRLPDDPALLARLQTLINTFAIIPEAPLQPADISTLAYAAGGGLDFASVTTWTADDGTFYITGEIANTSGLLLADVPVRAVLRDTNSVFIAEAADSVLGHGLPPGGFAPFSLHFASRPPAAASYTLTLGGDGWQPASRAIIGSEALDWLDESSLDAEGRLVVSGSVTNTGSTPVNRVRAVVTVFDAAQTVIAAGYADLTERLLPGENTAFTISIPHLGGTPANYIVSMQGLP